MNVPCHAAQPSIEIMSVISKIDLHINAILLQSAHILLFFAESLWYLKVWYILALLWLYLPAFAKIQLKDCLSNEKMWISFQNQEIFLLSLINKTLYPLVMTKKAVLSLAWFYIAKKH